MIKIFGHRSPDADSTGSSLIWEWYLTEVKGAEAQAKLFGKPSGEAMFMLDRWSFGLPEIIEDVEDGDDVVIVDTNNASELPDNIGNANIIEIIDHHLLQGGLATKTPIRVTMRPVACTATVMHQLMGADASKMPARVQGLMLTCILSDTLEFRSPTTTDEDRRLAESLADALGIDVPSYAAEMFKAKSDISAIPDAELLRMDSKKYELGGKRLRVSVVETTCPSEVLGRQAGLMGCMDAVAAEDNVDEVLLFVIDILNGESTLLVPNEAVRRIAEKSFGVAADGGLAALPGVVSRKKQIIPNLAL